LERYLKARPEDGRSRRLLTLCRSAQPDDLACLVPIASVLVEQQASALVDGLLRKYGKDSNEARQVLLKMYRERIEKAWPGKGQNLTIDARGLHLYVRDFKELTDLTPLKGIPLTSLNCHGTPLTDLSPLKGMPLTSLDCDSTQVSDLTPLQGMPLTTLSCYGTRVSDLTPLQGMPLTTLNCYSTPVTDLTPLQGMPLTTLNCVGTRVTDLTPLRGMPLTTLHCVGTRVTDLTPLQGMKLQDLRFTPKNITRGLDVIRAMPSLKTIGISYQTESAWPAAEFWERFEKGEFKK
jgi:hypothetical protein